MLKKLSPIFLFIRITFHIALYFTSTVTQAGDLKQNVASKVQMTHEKRREYCLKAFHALPSELQNQSSDFVFLKASNAFSKYKSEIIDFDTHCLRDKKSLFSSMSKAIDGAFGYFVNKTDKSSLPFCMGFFISEKKILSARHCFYKEQGLIPTDEIAFVLVSDPKTKFSIVKNKNLDVNFSEFTDQEDKIVLELKEITRAGFSKVKTLPRLSEVQDYAAFVIPTIGVHVLTGIGNSNKRSPIEFSYGLNCINTPRKFVQDDIPTGCLVHACQTLPGASGAPIFHVDNNQNVFVAGMHLRGGLTSDRSERGCGSHENFNVGVLVGDVKN